MIFISAVSVLVRKVKIGQRLNHAVAVKLGDRFQSRIASLSSWAYVAFSRDMADTSLL